MLRGVPMAFRAAQLVLACGEHLEHDEPRRGEVRAAMPRDVTREQPRRKPTVLACCSPLRSPWVRVWAWSDGSLTMMTTSKPSIHESAAVEWPALSGATDRCVACA